MAYDMGYRRHRDYTRKGDFVLLSVVKQLPDVRHLIADNLLVLTSVWAIIVIIRTKVDVQ